MESRLKWLWIVTFANVAVALLLVIVIRAMMLALAAFAAAVRGGALLTLLPFGGIALSIIGLRFARGIASRTSRRFGYCVNGCALALYAAVILGLGGLLASSTEERFIIPNGYMGDIYVIHGVADGASEERTFWGVTYRIPEDGILRAQAPMVRRLTRTKYYYQLKNGSLQRIRHFWPTTIHRTPENLANDRDIGVFFPRTGGLYGSQGCTVSYELFYVGTKANLLSNYKPKDMFRYAREHPVGCGGQSK